MRNDRDITTRRLMQQAKHCIDEALSVVERGEDTNCAIDDMKQAEHLCGSVLIRLKDMHRVER